MIGKFINPIVTSGVTPTGAIYILREYTSSTTWNKPTGLKELYVICIGGGSGGGSGATNSTAVTGVGGGSGGYGSAVVFRKYLPSFLNATESIVVGAGGLGGASVTGVTNGNDGLVGGASTFKGGTASATTNGVYASSSRGGAGGNRLSTGGATTYPWFTDGAGPLRYNSIMIASGQQSSCSNTASTRDGRQNGMLMQSSNTSSSTRECWGGSGAAGGGYTSTTTIVPFGNGSRLFNESNTLTPAVTSGSQSGNNNVLTEGLFWAFGAGSYYTLGVTLGLGTGGAGGEAGASDGSTAGQVGGNGGNYGAGGGGGGAARDTQLSGAGGVGGNGLVLLLEIY